MVDAFGAFGKLLFLTPNTLYETGSTSGERWHKGRVLRDARVKRGLTLFEEAAILDIEPIVLNDIEHGRRSSDELNHPSM